MKILRTLILLIIVILPVACDTQDLVMYILDDCMKNNIGSVRFQNASTIYTYDIQVVDEDINIRLLPGELSSYYTLPSSTEYKVKWLCVECNGHVSKCEEFKEIYIHNCQSNTLSCSD